MGRDLDWYGDGALIHGQTDRETEETALALNDVSTCAQGFIIFLTKNSYQPKAFKAWCVKPRDDDHLKRPSTPRIALIALPKKLPTWASPEDLGVPRTYPALPSPA